MAVNNSYSDNDLVELLKNDNHSAFKVIYHRYWVLLYNHALRMLSDEDQAKDVVQDVFTMLWTKRFELDIKKSLSSFLYTSVRNSTLNQIDRSKVRESYLASLQQTLDEAVNSPEEAYNEAELEQKIEREVARLPEKMRHIFEMRRIDQYSYREIAEKLDVTDHTVKKQISNALKILRTKFNLLFF